MALDFPTSPSNGDTHQASNGIQYIFDSSKSQWKSQGEFSSGAIEVKKIDDISGSFNGSTVTFTLNSGGSVVKPHNNQSVLITLNGLVQDPGTAYTTSITTGQITFSTAPTSGKTFTGVIYSRLPVSSSTTLSTTGGTMTGDIVFNSSQTFAIGGIQDGNTSQKGAVQLSTSTTSTSETLAATASAVKSVKDAIPSNLGDLSNVSSSSPSTNHVLKWSGSEWAPSAESGGGASTLAALTDVSSATPSNGQVLKYNTASSQWEPGTDATGGGGSGGTTNLGAVASGASLTITSSAGTDASIPAATTSSWGAMTDEMFDKLDGIAASANVGITDVVGDTTPQLGGNLDINGKDIVSVSNGDIDLAPHGTGSVVFKGGGSGGNSAGRFKLNCENNSHGITIQGPPHSAGANYTLTLPNDDGSSSQYLQTNGSGVLSWATVDLSTYATLASPALTGTATAVNLTLSGNLIVNGTTTTISSTTIEVTDKNIELGKVASPSDTTADGGGLTLKGSSDHTFNWVNATDAWTSSEHIVTATGKRILIGTTTEGHANADELTVASTGNTGITVRSGTSNNGSIFFADGTSGNGVFEGQIEYLHTDNSLKLHTNHALALTLDSSQNATFAGAVATAGNVDIGVNNKYLRVGSAQNLQMGYTGSEGIIKNIDDSTPITIKVKGGAETAATFNPDGAVELYHNGNLQCKTASYGLDFADGKRADFGTDSDLAIYHDGSNAFITNTTGELRVSNITGTGTVSDSKGDVRTIVQNTQGSAYTLVAADAGKHILASGNITVPDSVFSAGQAITIINNTGGDLTINKGTNMYNAADGTSANRTLATRGMATILFTAATTSYISGAGLT